jgi:hypothetical protein
MSQTKTLRAIKKLKIASAHEISELLDANIYTVRITLTKLLKNNEIEKSNIYKNHTNSQYYKLKYDKKSTH